MEEEEKEAVPIIVIDQGSYSFRAGFGGHDLPQYTLPRLTGTDKTIVAKDTCVGNEAQLHRDISNITHPINERSVTNWDDLQTVWQHIFHNLKPSPTITDEKKILLILPICGPEEDIEKTVETAMESLELNSILLSVPAVLSLYASGKVTGAVLDSGHTTSQCIPVYEGYPLPSAVSTLPIGGRHVTQYLMTLLNERKDKTFAIDNEESFDTVRTIKENLACVFFEEKGTNVQTEDDDEYILPDGSSITVGDEKYKCTESIFKPDLIGSDSDGIHSTIVDSIHKCDVDIQQVMFSNVLLSGGNTVFPRMEQRLRADMECLVAGAEINVLAPEGRSASCWVGGSILASSCWCCMKSMWFTKEEYEESGPSAIRKKL